MKLPASPKWAMQNMNPKIDVFYELSSELTGFDLDDLQGTDVGEELLETLVRGAGMSNVVDLLNEAAKVIRSNIALDEIVKDERFGPMVKKLTLMWYLGSWFPLSKEWCQMHYPQSEILGEHVVSVLAYKEQLSMKVIGAHAPGTAPSGFGSWAAAPIFGDH